MKVLNEENKALIDENAALKEQLQNAELLEKENERLRDYLDMKNKYPSFAMEEGMVISHSSGNYITNFTLNRGTLHGIKTNMPVITKEGIVGYVVEVGLNWCMVSTLIETATSVGAYIPRSEVVGIVSGDYSMRQQGTCKIGYIDASADVQVGDTVYSSGTGSVYPADLKIGTVTAIEVDEYNRTLVATVTPAVDFSELKWVMVITGYQNNSGDK
jgi:rod shape-determining protein MreC